MDVEGITLLEKMYISSSLKLRRVSNCTLGNYNDCHWL